MVSVPPTSASQAVYSKHTSLATFKQDVLLESMEHPVLVDFWASWCGPCKQLTPILEKLVAQANGRILLVQVNVDQHPQISQQMGIQSLPAVIAFRKGQPVDGFMGAHPESYVRAFIERLIGPLTLPENNDLKAGQEALDREDFSQAIIHFQAVYDENPTDLQGVIGLGRAYLGLKRYADAVHLLDQLPAPSQKDPQITALYASLALAQQAASIGSLEELQQKVYNAPHDLEAQFSLALALNNAQKQQEAADALLHIMQQDPHWKDEQARNQLLQFFEAWGPMDIHTIEARRKLSNLLFK